MLNLRVVEREYFHENTSIVYYIIQFYGRLEFPYWRWKKEWHQFNSRDMHDKYLVGLNQTLIDQLNGCHFDLEEARRAVDQGVHAQLDKHVVYSPIKSYTEIQRGDIV